MLLVLVPLLCLALPYLTSPQLALPWFPAWLGFLRRYLSVCAATLLHRGPLPLYTACASLFNSCQRLCLFSFCLDWTLYQLVVARQSIVSSTPAHLSCCRFEISVDRSLLSHSQALHLHPFAGLDPEPKPNQSAPQRNSIPIRYLDLPKAASTAILTCLQPPQSAIKQYSPTYSPSLDLSSLFRPILPDTYLDSTFSAPQPPALLP